MAQPRVNIPDVFPIVLSIKVALIALAIAAPMGLFVAYVQAKRQYRGKTLVDALMLLPLILPPSVIGFFLVTMLGRRGVLGPWLESAFDLRVVFSPIGAVIASSVVAFPLMVKGAQPALEAVPTEMEDVGRSLGLRPVELFFRVTLRSAWRGVLGATVLAFARALGEFGATLMVAGNIPNKTNTMPLEIFAAYQAGDDDRAFAYVLVLTALSLAVALAAAALSPKNHPTA